MYGQYHIPRGKNPALSCLIGFVSMDRAKQQNYSTIYSTSLKFDGTEINQHSGKT